uniref:Chloride channel CLIC-like protein 1 n=1 Tax=Oncorhynchus mykiss TaxID=8022 RepID=A0A8C7WF63_ONCMY
MKMSTSAVRTHTITVAVCSPLLVAQGQNYDPIIKSMRKHAEVQYKQLCNAYFRAMTVSSLEIIIILLCCFLLWHQCRQAVAEIQKVLEGMDSWRTGTLNDVLSQILRWHFEDTFGVEIDTVMKVSGVVLIIVVIICNELWSTVSLFVQFKQIFAIAFSSVWSGIGSISTR